MSIHDAAANGTLQTPTDLDKYRQSAASGFDIDAYDSSGRTALACGAWKGHISIVKLLINEGAQVNKLCKKDRTALWYASFGSIDSQKRLEVMNRLLDGGAQVDLQSDDGTTALMRMIDHRETKAINLLVNRGASVNNIKNPGGLTAMDLAKKTNDPEVIRALETSASRKTSRGGIVDVILTYLLWFIGFVNDLFQSSLKQLFGISGTSVDNIRSEMQHDGDAAANGPNANANTDADVDAASQFKTPDDFKDSMNKFISETGLDGFFAEDDKFLQEVAERAAKLKADPFNKLNKDDDVKDLTTVALYAPVMFCDDSSSMNDGNRAQDQRDIVQRITRIATRLVPDGYGVGLQFINHTRDMGNMLSAGDVDKIMNDVRPRGNTMLGTNLRCKVLNPLVYNVVNGGNKLKRPILVSIITDGAPNAESPDTFKGEILECISFLQDQGYEENAIRFQISQVGDDHAAEGFLRELQTEPRLQGLLYCTTQRLDHEFRRLNENEEDLDRWLLKNLMGPIMNATDI